MEREPLITLLKIRRRACDEALRSLVSALEAEEAARSATHDLERSIANEASVAADPESPDSAVEVYAAWLPKARKQVAAAEKLLSQRESETARRRAELTACRTALETVEALQQERADAIKLKQQADEQRELDDWPARTRPL